MAGAGSAISRATGPLAAMRMAFSYTLCQVCGPATPSTLSPASVCHARTASTVAAPYTPSTVSPGSPA